MSEHEKMMTVSQGRTEERTPEEIKSLIHRLNRAEGQIRGIRGMIEKNACCTDVMVQTAAATAALRAFTRELIASHIRTCVVEDVRKGSEAEVNELIDNLLKLIR